MSKNNIITPFNNQVESALRALCILNEAYPRSFDLQMLLCLDYISVHTADFDSNMSSLHAPVPKRIGEMDVRRALIKSGVDLLISKKLVCEIYDRSGIVYQASDNSAPFIDSLSSEYTSELLKRIRWVIDEYSGKTSKHIMQDIKQSYSIHINEFNFEVLD